MRGDDRHPDGMFSYRRPEERVPADHPPRSIARAFFERVASISLEDL